MPFQAPYVFLTCPPSLALSSDRRTCASAATSTPHPRYLAKHRQHRRMLLGCPFVPSRHPRRAWMPSGLRTVARSYRYCRRRRFPRPGARCPRSAPALRPGHRRGPSAAQGRSPSAASLEVITPPRKLNPGLDVATHLGQRPEVFLGSTPVFGAHLLVRHADAENSTVRRDPELR